MADFDIAVMRSNSRTMSMKRARISAAEGAIFPFVCMKIR